MSNQVELIQRWDSFLTKIESRFHESCNHAEEACIEILQESDYDYYTAFRAWQGMKSQIHDLISKIENTWEEKVEPEMRAIGDFWTTESYKASDLNDKLYKELDYFEKLLEAKISNVFYNQAIQTVNKKHQCTQCHSPLEIKANVFRTHYVPCDYCNATNTFNPDTKYAQIRWNIVDNIAWFNAKEAYNAMQKAIEEIHNQRPPVDEHYWQNYKRAYFSYHEKYLKERIKLDAEAEENYNQDMHKITVEYNNYETIHKKTK